jgi:hypothetical protein
MPPEQTGDIGTHARWRALCERFIDIKLGAFRYDLATEWRELAGANPDAPDLLANWEQLDERITELDDQELTVVTRHWSNMSADDDLLDDDEEADYVCPSDRCDRQSSAQPGAVPRCDLLGAPMKPKRNH